MGRSGRVAHIASEVGGAVTVAPFPPPPSRPRRLSGYSRLPPGGRGAGVGWEGRSRGRVGWGQEDDGWGAEGGSGGQAALRRVGPCGVVESRVSLFLTSAAPNPPPRAAVKACGSLGTPGGPFPREALGWR